MGNRFPAPIKHVTYGRTNRLLYGFCEMQGYRSEMEDGRTLAATIDGDDTRAFFGVYDGHSGSGTSELLSLHLLSHIKHSTTTHTNGSVGGGGGGGAEGDDDDVDEGRMGKISDEQWKEAFLTFDAELRKLEKQFIGVRGSGRLMTPEEEDRMLMDGQKEGEGSGSGGDVELADGAKKKEQCKFVEQWDEKRQKDIALRLGGSTAVTVFLHRTTQNDGWEVTCANIGDSRAVLSHRGKVVALSEDHKPQNWEERQRIEKAGGFVSGDRVDGNLALSRAFGDFVYKDELMQPHETKVIAIPDITRRIVLDSETYPVSFIVVACDGIWDVFPNDELDQTIRYYMQEIRLFDSNAPIPEKFLRSVDQMWNEKLVPDWTPEDQSAWLEYKKFNDKSHDVLNKFFETARSTGAYTEAVFDSSVQDSYFDDPQWKEVIQKSKHSIFERIKQQEEAVNNAKEIPKTAESKISLVARKIVDDAVFVRESMDNVSISIILLSHPKHNADTVFAEVTTDGNTTLQ